MFSLLSYGEVLIDFLPDDNGHYYPMAGGAPANVAVAFAKLGQDSFFAGAISEDNFGSFLTDALKSEGVNTCYCAKIKQASTALVLVSLDKSGERSFNFYRDNSADTKYDQNDIDKIDWQELSIFHFCSNTLTGTLMSKNTQYAIEKAKANNLLISFDVNLRQQLWGDLAELPERVTQCIKISDLVKFSKEEAVYLAEQAQVSYQDYLVKLKTLDVSLIVITDGPNEVQIIAQNFSATIKVPMITSVDTTAAGDSFIAGFLFALTEQALPIAQLSSQTTIEQVLEKKSLRNLTALKNAIEDFDKVDAAIKFAAKCGAYTCQRKGAFSALPRIDAVN